MGKLLRLDQWNFYTKNVNHITTIEKWFEITDWLHLEIESFYFSDFEIEHGVVPVLPCPTVIVPLDFLSLIGGKNVTPKRFPLFD